MLGMIRRASIQNDSISLCGTDCFGLFSADVMPVAKTLFPIYCLLSGCTVSIQSRGNSDQEGSGKNPRLLASQKAAFLRF
jgi:hypothetical protein